MPITHTIDHQRGYMETVITGPVTWADMEEHWAAELAERGETYPELIDGSGATVEFGAEEVRRLVAMLQTAAQSRRLGSTAIVVNTEVGFGMARMLSILVEPFCRICAFRDRASAEEWLGALIVPPDQPPS